MLIDGDRQMLQDSLSQHFIPPQLCYIGANPILVDRHLSD
jgi:hypothetical protein